MFCSRLLTKVVVCKILRNERREQAAAAGVMLLTFGPASTHPPAAYWTIFFLSFLGAKISHLLDTAQISPYLEDFIFFLNLNYFGEIFFKISLKSSGCEILLKMWKVKIKKKDSITLYYLPFFF
jgi:hypothetical protein